MQKQHATSILYPSEEASRRASSPGSIEERRSKDEKAVTVESEAERAAVDLKETMLEQLGDEIKTLKRGRPLHLEATDYKRAQWDRQHYRH